MLYRIRIRNSHGRVVPQQRIISRPTAVLACVQAKRWLAASRESVYLGKKYDQWTVHVYKGQNRDGDLIAAGSADA